MAYARNGIHFKDTVRSKPLPLTSWFRTCCQSRTDATIGTRDVMRNSGKQHLEEFVYNPELMIVQAFYTFPTCVLAKIPAELVTTRPKDAILVQIRHSAQAHAHISLCKMHRYNDIQPVH